MKNLITATLLSVVLIITCVFIGLGIKNDNKMPEEYMDGIRYLKNSLKDPASMVIYGDIYVVDSTEKDSQDKTILIGIRYNAHNAYGAMGGMDTGTIINMDSKWDYYSVNSDSGIIGLMGGMDGTTHAEMLYESLTMNLEIRESQLKEIKAGKSKLSKEAQEEAKESYDSLMKEKEKYHIYDGKKVAKALGCEYYEYK